MITSPLNYGIRYLKSAEHKKRIFYAFLRYSSTECEKIVIPKRIPRSPTDILKALSSTVKHDPTSAHYKYHDDPYLIPLSNLTKRMYALSEESGRKAAMWVKEQHPQLFLHKEADPPIEAYFPRYVFDETDDLNNDVLAGVIENAFVKDSIHVYELMVKKGIEVSDTNKQALLELVCFYNETEQLPDELIEERWYSQVSKDKQRLRKTWIDGGFADHLFKLIEPTPISYSTLIQGMCKYQQAEKAYRYFKEAIEKEYILSTDAYNGVITVVPFLKEGHDQRWHSVQEVLSIMNTHGVKPNLGTLNAVLEVLSGMCTSRDARRFALKMIAEVKQFGVQPSLSSFYYLLMIFCDSRSPTSFILHDILDDIDRSPHLKIREPKDIYFFVTAMEKCHVHMNDKETAYRLLKLLQTGDNYNLIGDAYKEMAFYRHLFSLLSKSESVEAFMELYDYLVPSIYSPDAQVMANIIQMISANGALEYYPRIWSDILLFELNDYQQVICALIEGMTMNKVPLSDPPHPDSIKLGNVAWSMYERIEDPLLNTRRLITWNGDMLGNIISLCVSADELDKAAAIINKFLTSEDELLTMPSPHVLTEFMDACITKKNIANAFLCLTYCEKLGYSQLNELAVKFAQNVPLSAYNRSKLAAIVGIDILNKIPQSAEAAQ